MGADASSLYLKEPNASQDITWFACFPFSPHSPCAPLCSFFSFNERKKKKVNLLFSCDIINLPVHLFTLQIVVSFSISGCLLKFGFLFLFKFQTKTIYFTNQKDTLAIKQNYGQDKLMILWKRKTYHGLVFFLSYLLSVVC